MFADEINALPRKRLGYQTSEELFDAQLDNIYALNTSGTLSQQSVQFVIVILEINKTVRMHVFVHMI